MSDLLVLGRDVVFERSFFFFFKAVGREMVLSFIGFGIESRYEKLFFVLVDNIMLKS